LVELTYGIVIDCYRAEWRFIGIMSRCEQRRRRTPMHWSNNRYQVNLESAQASEGPRGNGARVAQTGMGCNNA
jgi:hypothetical protein